MKISSEFTKTKIMDNIIIVPVGRSTLDLKGVLGINESAEFLWDLLSNDISKEDLIKALMNEYELSEEKAATDVDSFLNALNENGILIDNA